MSLTIRVFRVINRTLVGGRSYFSAAMQSVFFTVPADRSGTEKDS